MNDFPAILKSHRKRRKLTQEQAAALLEVSLRQFWEWENGRCVPLAITQEGAIRRLSARK